jgi:hypothetical protein
MLSDIPDGWARDLVSSLVRSRREKVATILAGLQAWGQENGPPLTETQLSHVRHELDGKMLVLIDEAFDQLREGKLSPMLQGLVNSLRPSNVPCNREHELDWWREQA